MSKFVDRAQLDTHPVGLHWTGDQLLAEATVFPAHNKNNERTRDSSRLGHLTVRPPSLA